MFLQMLRRKKQQLNQKPSFAYLVGQPRAAAITALTGRAVEFVALKAGEALPTAVSPSIYVVAYDSITDRILSVA